MKDWASSSHAETDHELQHRLRPVGNTPRRTFIEIVQVPIGILGIFVSLLAVFGGDELNVLALATGAICLLVYATVEFTLICGETPTKHLSTPSASLSEMICRLNHHAFHPEGITTEDRFGLASHKHPPLMVWTCSRCDENRWVEPGITPDCDSSYDNTEETRDFSHR